MKKLAEHRIILSNGGEIAISETLQDGHRLRLTLANRDLHFASPIICYLDGTTISIPAGGTEAANSLLRYPPKIEPDGIDL
jgi:hypothetical protein